MNEFSDETKLLRTLTGDPDPSVEQRMQARRRLDGELLAEQYPSRGLSRGWMAFSLAFGATAVAAGFFLFSAASQTPQEDILLTRGDTTGVESTESTYRLYVESIRLIEPLQVSDDTVIHTQQVVAELSLDPGGPARSPFAVVNRKRIEGTWAEGEGMLVTVQDPPTPHTYDPDSSGNGLSLDPSTEGMRSIENQQIVTTIKVDTSALPIDRASLETTLNDLLNTDHEQPRRVRLFQLVETINMSSQVSSPAFRSTLLEILGELGAEQTWNVDGTVSLSMASIDPLFGQVTQTLTFDPSGYLVRSSVVTIGGLPTYGVPAFSEIRVMTLNPPEIVNS